MSKGPQLSINGAQRVRIAPQNANTQPRSQPIGLGADLSRAPDMPGRNSTLFALIGIGGVAFALGVAATLWVHMPDRSAQSDAIDAPLETGAQLPRVARNLGGMLDRFADESTSVTAEAQSTQLGNTIALTPEQQSNIAAVLALAGTSDAAEAPRFHVVGAGDSLTSIATRYFGDSTAVPALVRANRTLLSQTEKLAVGMRLTLPDFTPPVPDKGNST